MYRRHGRSPPRGHKYYGVRRGRQGRAVYDNWEECEDQVKGFSGAEYKSFLTEREAERFAFEGPRDDEDDGGRAGSYGGASGGGGGDYAYIGGFSVVYDDERRDSYSTGGGSGRPRYKSDYNDGRRGSGNGVGSSSSSSNRSRGGGQRGNGRRSARMYFDGGARGNPGVAGAGAVIYDDNGTELVRESEFVGHHNTNNEAEYRALLLGLKLAKELGVTDLKAYGDSLLVVKHMRREWEVRSQWLRPLFNEAQALAREFTSFQIDNIPREENGVADELANEAMDRRR